MSDSTANAREPSMEDILASIRRIIDEEDTRDARPASDMAVDDAQDGDHAPVGTPPVMAAAPVGRDDAARAPRDDDASDDDRGDAIFPERESLFWSRATGRGDAPADRGDDEAAAPGGPRTDIFRRAQSKLGSASRPGARERIQSLAARAEERAESAAHDRGSLAELEELSDPIEADRAAADWTEDDGTRDGEGRAASAVAAFAAAGFHDDQARDDEGYDDEDRDDTARGDAVEHSEHPEHDDAAASDAVAALDDDADDRGALYPALGDDGVLDLTESLDHEMPSAPVAAPRFDGLSDDEDRMDMARRDTAAPDDEAEAATGSDPEALHGMFEPEGAGDGQDGDDVLDLTTPFGEEPATVDAGSVENGDSFQVSDVARDEHEERNDAQSEDRGYAQPEDRDDGERAEDDIEDAIARNLEAQDGNLPADDRMADAGAADDDAVEEGGYHDTAPNTYSRFDREDEAPETEPDGTVAEDDFASRAEGDETGSDDDTDRDETARHAASDDTPPEETARDDDAPEETARDDVAAEETAADGAEDDDSLIGWAQDDDAPDETVHAAASMPDLSDMAAPSAIYAAAFTMRDDEPSAETGVGTGAESGRTALADDLESLDDLDMGEELGFSDTFSASDVYHDDPPTLDEDYSRSLDVEDEPVAARAESRDDAPDEGGSRDKGMEKVGGLVRDAMERDPVDYADPSALVSMTSEEISARALASLADVEGEASRRMFGSLRISDDDGSESLEGMVRGMLRPLLREWLDDNLPTMVESAVRGEVERISAKSRKYSRAADKD